jgi:hypothetical protein
MWMPCCLEEWTTFGQESFLWKIRILQISGRKNFSIEELKAVPFGVLFTAGLANPWPKIFHAYIYISTYIYICVIMFVSSRKFGRWQNIFELFSITLAFPCEIVTFRWTLKKAANEGYQSVSNEWSVFNECIQSMNVFNECIQWMYSMNVFNECIQWMYSMNVFNECIQWMVSIQWSVFNGQYSMNVFNECIQWMVSIQWSVFNGQYSMVSIQWMYSMNVFNECIQWMYSMNVFNECIQWMYSMNGQCAKNSSSVRVLAHCVRHLHIKHRQFRESISTK